MPAASPQRARAWTLLYESFPVLQNVIHANTINNPENGMTLRAYVRRHFGDFRIALEAESNEYIVQTFRLDTYLKRSLPSRITFQNACEGKLALPTPDLLHCHFIMAKILHASGMGQVVENFMRE
ncbi:hypothetical protein N7453_004370 [Penicillium expansum]|nr:hypothetical protein N7453_004370 [Penicillium expansum]